MTPRIGLLLFTALLMQCENPVETPCPVWKPFPRKSGRRTVSMEETLCSTPRG